MTTRDLQHHGPSAVQAVALGAGAVAALPGSCWLLGCLDRSSSWITDPDYAITPPQIDRALAHLIGASSTIVVAVAISVIAAGIVRGRWRGCVAGVFLPVAAGFAYVGVAGHVATAPVIGANIGAGLLLVAAPPTAAVLGAMIASALKRCRRPFPRAAPRLGALP